MEDCTLRAVKRGHIYWVAAVFQERRGENKPNFVFIIYKSLQSTLLSVSLIMKFKYNKDTFIKTQFLHTDSSDPEFKGRKFQDAATDWSVTGWLDVNVHFNLTFVPLTASTSLGVWICIPLTCRSPVTKTTGWQRVFINITYNTTTSLVHRTVRLRTTQATSFLISSLNYRALHQTIRTRAELLTPLVPTGYTSETPLIVKSQVTQISAVCPHKL